MTWFVDKLGPSPLSGGQQPARANGAAHQAPAATAPRSQTAAPPPRAAAPSKPAPAPEPEKKKKKGWF